MLFRSTLRPANSRVNLREGLASPQGTRSQAPRMDLRTQSSRRRLNNQASTRTLRASEHGRPPQSPSAATQNSTQAEGAPRSSRLSQEETTARARELVNNRRIALEQSGTAPSRNNPFVPGFRRPAAEVHATTSAVNTPHHTRSNSNESLHSNSSHTVSMTPSSPRLTRQRSNRHIAAAPPGVLSPTLGAFQSPATAYTGNHFRRQTPLGSSAFEMPLDANARGMSPMMATSLI